MAARSLNEVKLIGHVGGDPEVRTAGTGTKIAKVNLATNRRVPGQNGEYEEKTDWHRLTFFGKRAGVIEQYLQKGSQLYVDGRIEYSQTQDDKGNTRYWTSIVVNNFIFLGGGSRSGGAQSQQAPAGASAPAGDVDDSLPF